MLKKYLQPGTKRILSIAGGLDNSLAFLENEDIEVLAIDSNPSQVYLSRLKVAAIKYLSYIEFLILLGFKEGDSLLIYSSIKKNLDKKTKDYFDQHLFLIENKLIHAGRFEYYFHIFKTRIMPFVASKKKIEAFMQIADLEEQKRYYDKHINTWFFKLLFRIFFSKRVMARLGRDKAYFTYAKGSLAKRLKARVDMGIRNVSNATNSYLQYAMLGEFKELPYYAQEEVFLKIKRNIEHITVLHTSFEEAIESYGDFDFMNLSDIFEYMPKDLTHFEQKIQKASSKNARIAFWNMMNPRYFSGLFRLNTEEDLKEDKAMYYQDFIVYEVNHD